MKYLNDLGFKSIEQVLWLDIETATLEKELTEESTYWNAWEQKVRWDEKVVTVDDIKQRYKERAPIYKEFAKVVSVSYGRVVEGVLKVKKVVGTEKEIIETLFKDVETFVGGGVKFLGVFSGKQFDIPFISYRAIVNDIPLINSFDIGGIPVWNIKHLIDIQDILRGTSSTALSLEGVCASFNIPSPKEGEVVASNVNEMFWAGEIDKISDYNAKDVLATCNAFCKYLRIPQVEMKIVGEDKVEELSLLEKIYNSNQITLDIKNEIEELVKKKKPTKKEKEHLFTILRGVYVRADFENNDQDSKKTIEQKENEIKELLKV